MIPSRRTVLVRLLPVAVPLLLWGCRADGEPADPEPAGAGAETEAPIPEVSSPVLEVTDTELRLHTGGAQPLRVGLDGSADGGRFVAAALRPGDTEEGATVVAVVMTDDAYALRWTSMDDGGLAPLRSFPSRFDHLLRLPRIEGVEPSLTWTPDGGSIALTGWTDQGVATLQTLGWADGPGTGEPATDNASFVLEPVPAGSRIVAWRPIAPATWHAELESVDGARWILLVERQGDGALALPRPSSGNPCLAPCDPR